MRSRPDHYARKAKQQGYAARSAYKLEATDRRRNLLKPGMRVLDLGCAPGSWLQYAAGRVGPRGAVVGVDLQPVTVSLPDTVRVLEADALEIAPETLLAGGAAFDLVLSDMAPRTTGIKQADAARSAELVERALALACAVLRPGGHLLVKVFQGGRMPALRKAMQQHFETVTTEKPAASRAESVEVFLLGRGLRGSSQEAAPEGSHDT